MSCIFLLLVVLRLVSSVWLNLSWTSSPDICIWVPTSLACPFVLLSVPFVIHVSECTCIWTRYPLVFHLRSSLRVPYWIHDTDTGIVFTVFPDSIHSSVNTDIVKQSLGTDGFDPLIRISFSQSGRPGRPTWCTLEKVLKRLCCERLCTCSHVPTDHHLIITRGDQNLSWGWRTHSSAWSTSCESLKTLNMIYQAHGV